MTQPPVVLKKAHHFVASLVQGFTITDPTSAPLFRLLFPAPSWSVYGPACPLLTSTPSMYQPQRFPLHPLDWSVVTVQTVWGAQPGGTPKAVSVSQVPPPLG
jgi:hypothetical protein